MTVVKVAAALVATSPGVNHVHINMVALIL